MITCLHAAYPVYWALLLVRLEAKTFCLMPWRKLPWFPMNLRIACAWGHREGGRIPGEGSKGDEHLLPWDSLPRMGVAAVLWWRIEVNKLIGVEIHRIRTKFIIHSWNGTWFLGAQWCCCQRLGLLAKPLKCWTLTGLAGKNKHTVKEILAYPAMLLLKPWRVKSSSTLVASCRQCSIPLFFPWIHLVPRCLPM